MILSSVSVYNRLVVSLTPVTALQSKSDMAFDIKLTLSKQVK